MSLRACVVIPGYNVASTLGPVLAQVKQLRLDAIVVNDGSTDQTVQVATAAGALVISHLRNRGKGAALRTGFAFALQAGYDAIVTLDSDGQHDPMEIPRLLEAAEDPQAAIIVGHRIDNGAVMPRARRWTNRLMSVIVSRLAGQSIPDSQSGFRVIRRHVLEAIELSTSHFEIETELLLAVARKGWPVISVPIRTIYHHHPSHIHPIRDGIRFCRLILRYLCGRPPSQSGS